MPAGEVRIWQAYMAKNGPLSMQRRTEAGFAQLAMILANANRDPKKPAMRFADFLLWSGVPEVIEGVEQDMQQAMQELFKVAGPRAGAEPKRRKWKRAG